MYVVPGRQARSGRGRRGLASLSLSLSLLAGLSLVAVPAAAETPAVRPSILWITCEDASPNLGCYGDRYAVTPNLDRLAAASVRYTNAFAPIGVCAPARSCLITGMFPPAIGTQHMRCQGRLPRDGRFFPEVLREAGYYTTNNSKTDYNLPLRPGAWDESSPLAHWRHRQSREQPFFAVFNFLSSHESQIRLAEDAYRERIQRLPPEAVHDPAGAPLPPYHPDTPEVRRDWARYADMVTFMDQEVGALLGELEADGLAGETIVFFFSDHGAGMPRSKRWLYDSSLRVPLLIRFPEKLRGLAPGAPGSTSSRLVSFVDFGPTVLSLAGCEVPSAMQGKPFLGPRTAEPRSYIHGFRDRMDERYDLQRCVRDARFKYIRNFLPHRPWFGKQHIGYMYEMPTMRVWQRLADEGRLSGPAAAFMAPEKPLEELYDTEADPHEVRNLAASPEHRATLERLRAECRRWMLEVVDLGLLPEEELRRRFGEKAPHDAVREAPALYPLPALLDAADLAARRDPAAAPELLRLLEHADPAVRWWGAVGLNALGARAPASAASAIEAKLTDPSASVRVELAEALARMGRIEAALPVLSAALADPSEAVRLAALNALDRLDEGARPALPAIEAARADASEYVRRVAERALEAFAGKRG